MGGRLETSNSRYWLNDKRGMRVDGSMGGGGGGGGRQGRDGMDGPADADDAGPRADGEIHVPLLFCCSAAQLMDDNQQSPVGKPASVPEASRSGDPYRPNGRR